MPWTKIFKTLTNWEAWPFGVLYAPIAPAWLGYILKSRVVWFFTPANPKITFGGITGESKSEIYKLLPAAFIPSTIFIEPGITEAKLLDQIKANHFNYPFVVKPDVGEKGMMFRKIDNETQLLIYHRHSFARYLVQAYSPYPLEVSVFYTRLPTEDKGIISGFLMKTPMHVTGDGKSRLIDLIQKHDKASTRIGEMELRHAANFELIIPPGEKYMLSHAGNHNRGAQFTNLMDRLEPGLTAQFDHLSKQSNDLYYGRYDIMCQSVADLLQWRHFQILEFNGVGAEPNHFYDTGYRLKEAYKEILWHWQRLYQISMANRQLGIAPWRYKKGKKFMQESRVLLRRMKVADETLSF